ncbi:MAG: YncE family protein [Salegentibacter sp.]
MKRTQHFTIFAILGLLFFTSCQKEDSVEPVPDTVTYSGGTFILNEGNYGSGNSSVSFLDPEGQEITRNIFAAQNRGEALGDTGQSMGFYGDLAFIILNLSNKIEVVNRFSFEEVATIEEGLKNPRYIAFSAGKVYVTNWGDGTNADDDFVAVINAETFEIEKKISVTEGPDEIVEAGGKIYVAHPGGFSFSNKISVIDPESNTVAETIEVGDVPNSLEVSGDYLWVACSGFPSYASEETAGEIAKIDLNTNEIVGEYNFENITDHPANLEVENASVYYTIGNDVYSFPTDSTALPASADFGLEDVSVLYSFEVNNGLIYAASANSDFTGNGKLLIYETSEGELLNSFDTGINPGGIYFND